ncbi:MAG: ATP-binding region ATPase domain protein [Chitinophagaceae bacterium]|nr:ATP-binding region ATPase domain protein [Chitinophagaceae bacterium]
MSSETRLQPTEPEIDQLNQQAWGTRVSDSNNAQVLSREAVELAKKINYIKGKAEGLRTLGFCFIRLSKHEEANAYLKESLFLFESLKDLRGQSTVYEYFGIIQRSWGNLGDSLEWLLKSLELSQQTDFFEAEVTNYYHVGVTYKQLGDYEKALDNLFKSLSLAQSTNFSLMVGYAVNVIGSIYFETGDFNRALEYYQQGLGLRQLSGDQWGEAGSLDNIGSTYLKLGAWQQAIDYCAQSLAISEGTGDKKGQANALLHLAEIYKRKNDLDKAMNFCVQSLQIRQTSGDKKGEAEIHLFLAELKTVNFKNEKNVDLFEDLFKALKIAEEIKAADLLGKTHWALYESYKLSEDYLSALNHLELHITIEKGLHKDTINQKVLNLEISHRAEESKKETDLFRLRNVELAKLYEESNKQKEEIEQQKKNVEETLTELKSTQKQLIQSEKMASLGELTAGIAHEIQNPLNFVNNFSEVNTELIEEASQEIDKANINEVRTILNDIKENEQKINRHGKRADSIVKAMLQHSRSSTGQQEPTDINALAEEYLRISYHGLRAKDKSPSAGQAGFNVNLQTYFDHSIGKINIIPQDMGRVLLNLYNNAFYAVNEKKKQSGGSAAADRTDKYEPTVSVTTKKTRDPSGNYWIEIRVKDNGPGIPQQVIDKIFQPFFTTKPTGQGTGLGLSLSYDIIKAHGGEIKVESEEGESAEFTIRLPLR